MHLLSGLFADAKDNSDHQTRENLRMTFVAVNHLQDVYGDMSPCRIGNDRLTVRGKFHVMVYTFMRNVVKKTVEKDYRGDSENAREETIKQTEWQMLLNLIRVLPASRGQLKFFVH